MRTTKKRKNRSKQQQFKDFVITEANSKVLRGSSSGEFLVCKPVRDRDGNINLQLDLPSAVKKQMFSAMRQGQKIRLFSPQG